jgi:hypothetical protein
MATPHVAGVAALVKQANPTWSVGDLRAAVVQTSSPAMMQDYTVRYEGAGLVQPVGATTTQAVVRAPSESLSFGYADLLTDYSSTKTVTVHNAGPKAVQFNIAVVKSSGPAGASLSAPASVIVGAASDATFPVTLNVPAATVGGGLGFQDISGYIRLTPSSSRLNGNVSLSVPWYLVAHSRSNLAASLSAGTLNFTNTGGAISGTPGFYIWGLTQPTPQAAIQADVRAVGARFATIGATPSVIFGFNTYNRTSTTLAFQEFNVCIDTSGAPGFNPNKVLIGINGSAFGSTAPQNTFTTALFPTNAGCILNGSNAVTGGGSLLFTVTQPTDNSTLQLPHGGHPPLQVLGGLLGHGWKQVRHARSRLVQRVHAGHYLRRRADRGARRNRVGDGYRKRRGTRALARPRSDGAGSGQRLRIESGTADHAAVVRSAQSASFEASPAGPPAGLFFFFVLRHAQRPRPRATGAIPRQSTRPPRPP